MWCGLYLREVGYIGEAVRMEILLSFKGKGGGEVDDAQRMRPEYTILHPHPIYHQ